FGIPREHAVGRSRHDNWTDEQAAQYREADERAVADGGQEINRRAIVNARGESLIAHVRKVALGDGDRITHLLVIMDDITQRVAGEEELRNNRAFFQSLVDNAPIAIYVKDVRPPSYGTMLVWNKRIEEITNLAEKD